MQVREQSLLVAGLFLLLIWIELEEARLTQLGLS